MAGLLYYLPDQDPARPNAVTPAWLADHGLGHAFEGRCVPSGVRGAGPEGAGPGVIVAADDRTQPGYYPERQAWRRAAGKAWLVGYYRDQPPGPDDLARSPMLDGHLVRLADGHEWRVPLARGWSDDDAEPGWYHALPRLVDLDADGRWTMGEVVPPYQRLWQVACAWWDARHAAAERADGEATAVEVRLDSFASLAEAAVIALAVNYRLGADEVALLGLFDSRSPAAVLDAAVDYPTFLRWAEEAIRKKKDSSTPAGSSTDAGPAGATAVTGPPSPT